MNPIRTQKINKHSLALGVGICDLMSMFAILWCSHLIFSALIATSLWHFAGNYHAASFVAGALLVNLNLLSHALAWSLIFRKKLIALGVSIVVSKYAIIGVLIYLLSKNFWFQPSFFVLGIATLSFVAIGFGLMQKSTEPELQEPVDPDALMFK